MPSLSEKELTSTMLHTYLSLWNLHCLKRNWPPLYYIHIWICDTSTVWKGTNLHYVTYISESLMPPPSENELTSTMLHTYLSLWYLHCLKRNWPPLQFTSEPVKASTVDRTALYYTTKLSRWCRLLSEKNWTPLRTVGAECITNFVSKKCQYLLPQRCQIPLVPDRRRFKLINVVCV